MTQLRKSNALLHIQGNRMSVGIDLSVALPEAQSSPNSGDMEFHWTFATELGHGIYAGL